MSGKIMKAVSLLLAILLLAAAGCGGQAPVELTGEYVANPLKDCPKTEYVYCVSGNSAEATALIAAINQVIKDTDVAKLAETYTDYAGRRSANPIGQIDLSDNTGDYIFAYTTVLEPFNFSGAGGAYADGVDVWMIEKVAENLNRRLQMDDLWYTESYAAAKAKAGAILAMGVALTDDVKKDFQVSDVYMSGYQQIISDKAQGFTSMKELKGLRIGVLAGRTGEKVVKEAMEKGDLKGSNASVVAFNTDADAYLGLKNDVVDVVIMDELAAKIAVARGY
ncbi:MAG: transporter substrate-binding domain-containing protein [Lachnospiraceae bacterium]|nr:transporter substrate-binding domain-containing protein [Lachnospiraceae bacterium]